MIQALVYAVCEEMKYYDHGEAREKELKDYHIFRSDEVLQMEALFIESFESSHPFGIKAGAEIPMDGVAPAVANALSDTWGAQFYQNPATPERIWRALNELK